MLGVLQTNHLIRIPVVNHEGKSIGIEARRNVVRGYFQQLLKNHALSEKSDGMVLVFRGEAHRISKSTPVRLSVRCSHKGHSFLIILQAFGIRLLSGAIVP